MLEVALARLRLGSSVLFGWHLSPRALDTLAEATRQAYLERGRLGDGGDELLPGPALDEGTTQLLQGRRFRRQARIAAEETAYYRELFQRAGIDPGRLDYASMPTVPLTSRQALREDPEAFVRAGARPAERVVTAGTTGRPAAVWLSRDELRLMAATGAIAALTGGLVLPGDSLHVAISSRARLAAGTTARVAATLGALCDVAGLIDPTHTLALLSGWRRVPGHKPRVSVLTTYPSYLGELVEVGLAQGYTPADFGVERVVLGGEVCSEALRWRARRLLGDRVAFRESYAMTEIAPVAGSQCAQGHLHFPQLAGIVEVLDLERRGPAGPGEPGVLAVTPLPPLRQASVVLRYDTGDVVPVLPRSLTCEQAGVPATGPPLGRLRLAVRHDQGWTFTRDVVEALEAVEAVPLPARYGFWDVPGGVAVEVAVRSATPTTRLRVGAQLDARGVPLAELHLVEDPAHLRAPAPLRCDLREASFRWAEQLPAPLRLGSGRDGLPLAAVTPSASTTVLEG